MNTTWPTPNACRWCGSYHNTACPKVKAIEYHRDGSVKRVEFHDQPTALPTVEITQTITPSPGVEVARQVAESMRRADCTLTRA